MFLVAVPNESTTPCVEIVKILYAVNGYVFLAWCVTFLGIGRPSIIFLFALEQFGSQRITRRDHPCIV